MKLIVGLGNPEKDYKETRHNVGFEVINKFAYDNNIEINKAKFNSHMGESNFAGEKIILLKPQRFMNLSGLPIKEAMDFYKLGTEDLIVVYDDVDLDVGDIRIRKSGSGGSHIGMKDIIYQIESDDFIRIRVGIGSKPSYMDLADYVLSKFRNNEIEYIREGITNGGKAIETILKENVDIAMNKYNTRHKGE